MPRFLKHLIGIIVVILIAGCGGGGCSTGCSSCGMTPLPGGFDPNARIENAGSVRLTQSGLQFLQDNLGPLAKTLIGGSGSNGLITFPIPATSGSTAGIQYDVCPGGPDPNANPPKCVAEIDVGNAQLSINTSNPHNIHITGPLPIRIQDLPIDIVYLFIPDSATARLTGNGCSNPPGFANVNLDVDISIEVDTNQAHSRYGYSRVKVNNLSIDQNQLKDSLNFCGGGFSNFVLGALKGVLFNMLVGPLLGTLQDQIDSQLCQQANPMLNPPCPTGTNDVNGVCRYGTTDGDECASIILGTDGNMNLGAALASVSPGTKGGLDILFAVGGPSARPDNSGFAWGDLNPIANGATLGMYGGAEPTPISSCVKFSDMPLPAGIPIPDELQGNTIDPWQAGLDGPHVGIALSERFANYALNSMYNSGFLCLGISTETVPQLSSGTLALLAGSLKQLGLQSEPQQVALVIRPNKPPTVTFGNGTDINKDPLLRVKLPQASFDFYIWSLDRFIRFMTATFDLDVPVNLTVTPQGLLPVLDKIGVENGVVTNSELLKEDPALIAAALQGLIGSLGSQFLGGINPIDLSSALGSLGLTLTIPETVAGKGSPGLKRLDKGSDGFLGIFATLGVAPNMPVKGGSPVELKIADTTARVISKELDKSAFRIGTMNQDNAPKVTLQMSSPLDTGAVAMEYSYRVDNGMWKPFTRERTVDVRDEWLRLQGKHTISVRSRIADEPLSLDPTPAEIEVVIDAEPPMISVTETTDAHLAINVRDVVGGGAEPRARYRLDNNEWSAWQNASELSSIDFGDASEIAVQAEDSEGNIAEASQALIRGRAIVTGAGCGCSVVGDERTGSSAGWLAALGLIGIAFRLGRRRANKAEKAEKQAAPAAPASQPAATKKPSSRTLQALTGLMVIGAAGSFSGCSCTDDQTTGAQYTCVSPCETLVPGLIGAYTSAAVSGSDIWVAGYVEANWVDAYTWGDLAVGRWDGTKVTWTAVDGVPADPPVDPTLYNKNDFRGGQTEPGDDVGLWTSIAIDPAKRPAVAYYDRTNKALKFTHAVDGKWQTITVESKPLSDIGRYAKLLYQGDKAVIAYLAIEPGKDGAITSKVRLATATTANPTDADWTFEDVAANEASPCRAYNCDTNTACVKSTGKCQAELGTCASCASGTACVDINGTPTCEDIFDSSKLDTYPDAFGDYISLAQDTSGNLGIAFYDRIKGNLMAASKKGGAWTTMIVDGEAPDGTDTGDMGIGASLFIDEKGTWHISYVDGLSEGLKYAQLESGTTLKLTDIADDGLAVDGIKFDDGQHLVGDDSNIYVGASGEIHITYQDATAGKLRYTTGTITGANITWKQRVIDQPNFAGAFSRAIIVNNELELVNWWRKGGEEPAGDVNILKP